MKIRRIAAIATIAVAASGGFAAGPASGDFVVCPDGFFPAPVMALPPGEGEKADRNNNGQVCAKGPQGSNGHFNVKDDRLLVDDVV